MEFISVSDQIKRKLRDLIRTHDRYWWSVAWASPGQELPLLGRHSDGVEKFIIGLHFWQTHPDFIEQWMTHPNVRFILKPSGVYHPKVYYFEKETGEWATIVGSANYTQAAMTANQEAALLVTHEDNNAEETRNQIISMMDSNWDLAEPFNPDHLAAYREQWKRKRKTLDSISGEYGKSAGGSPVTCKIRGMPWSEFYDLVLSDSHASVASRLRILDFVQDQFESYGSFSFIADKDRKRIAGFVIDDEHWTWFGGMKGAGDFMKLVNANALGISDALDRIPLHGIVREEDYRAFCYVLEQAFAGKRLGIAGATRLLAMKRPDYFLCLNKQNATALSQGFGIPQKVTLENYWERVILRIMDSVWWNSPPPSAPEELGIWQGRSAFLDVLYYVPSESADALPPELPNTPTCKALYKAHVGKFAKKQQYARFTIGVGATLYLRFPYREVRVNKRFLHNFSAKAVAFLLERCQADRRDHIVPEALIPELITALAL